MAIAIINGPRRLLVALFTALKFNTKVFFVFGFDFILFICNLVTPRKRPGKITTCGGKWPKYIAPQPGDSRSSCPALNALANHGVLPRSGRGIPFVELDKIVRDNFNFAPSFCWFVPNYIANFLGRDYATDKFDLEDISVHNGIEHDASLTREDTYLVADQGKPSHKLVDELLSSGTGPDGCLTPKDLSRVLAKRRVESRNANPQYSQAFIHKMFGSSNSSTLITHFGGDPKTLRPFLLHERLPDDWEPVIRDRMGLTMFKFNTLVLGVEASINENEVKPKQPISI